jgi:hypothetical protein
MHIHGVHCCCLLLVYSTFPSFLCVQCTELTYYCFSFSSLIVFSFITILQVTAAINLLVVIIPLLIRTSFPSHVSRSFPHLVQLLVYCSFAHSLVHWFGYKYYCKLHFTSFTRAYSSSYRLVHGVISTLIDQTGFICLIALTHFLGYPHLYTTYCLDKIVYTITILSYLRRIHTHPLI